MNRRITQAIALLSVLCAGIVLPATTTIMQNWETIAHADTLQGTCGDCVWEITDPLTPTGRLTIKPANGISGELANSFDWTSSTYRDQFTSITIEPGVIANTSTKNMFFGLVNCKTIENLNNLDVSNVTDMTNMFSNCGRLENFSVTNWDTSNVHNMSSMFAACQTLTSLDLSSFDTQNVKSMQDIFAGCNALQTLNLKNWDTSEVQDMGGMFSACYDLQTLDTNGFDTKNVQNMDRMFNSCEQLNETQFAKLGLSDWDTSKVTNMYGMFMSCVAVKKFELNNWDTANVDMMSSMFYDCVNLEDPQITSWNTAKVTDISGLFYNCTALEQLNLSSWDTADVTDMASVFENCTALKQLNIDGWNTANVQDIQQVFNDCASLEQLDLSSWDTSSVSQTNIAFGNTSALWKLALGKDFQLSTTLWNDLGINVPVVGTKFDGNYTVNSANWREVGTGTAHNPNGTECTADEIRVAHGTSGKSDTYVWQADLLAPVTVTINYLDADNGNSIIKTDATHIGNAGADYTISDDILNDLKTKGYEFDHADADYQAGTYGTDKTINIYMKHGTTIVQTSKTVKQVIHYMDENKNTLAANNVQELVFFHNMTTDNVTHEILNDKWTAAQTTNAVTSPDVAGYTTTNQVVVGQSYAHTNKVLNEINVIYTAIVTGQTQTQDPTTPADKPITEAEAVPTPTDNSNPGNAAQTVFTPAVTANILTGITPAQVETPTPVINDTTTSKGKIKEKVVKSDKDSLDDKTIGIADEDSADSWWLWLWGLLAAAVLAALWFLWCNRRQWIHEIAKDENNVMHYWANKWTPLGYFVKYFGTHISEFENHKHARLLNHIFGEQPDFKVGDTIQVGEFNITARGEAGQKITHLEVTRIGR
ncbi:MAG: BspA family leucine-rich repeat surface protein [Lactobacillaceae bacterium]|nr:BspA family leucine-rich repeat surface protein [Lactobacillaceae bacterium]